MQKFLRLIIILFLFIVCLLIGANLANVTLTGERNVVINQDSSDENQTRILIFVVDQLENRKPNLTSVWSVIFYYQDSKGLMFIPLTDQTNENFNELENAFILTSEKFIHERTVKFFNTKFKTKWDSAIVLDQYAINYLTSWISQNEIEGIPQDQTDMISGVEEICSIIAKKQPAPMIALDWPTIYPTHFKSDQSTEQMSNVWQNQNDTDALLCEVIYE
jgi:hypothetical protein